MNAGLLCSGMALFSVALAQGQVAARPSPAQPERALVTRYCVGCHNDSFKSGDLSLVRLNLAHPDQTAELAEKVIHKLRAGMMPPPGLPRPDPAILKAFVTSLETPIDQAAALHPNPGRPALHRLNRTEYANSIRELLDVDVDVTPLLPADDMSHGFDNMADVLTISPALMEGYIRAAGKISREAVGDPTALALTTTYSIPRVLSQTRHVDGTPIGTRGGLAVVHDFPADGEYTFKLGFYYSPTGPLFGMNQGKGQEIEVAVNGERVALVEISPSMTLAKDGIKTPPIRVRAGPQRISASFPQKFDGPIEDEYRMVEQSLVDVSVGALPGMTTLPHLHEFSITGPIKAAGVSNTPARRKIFTCRPVARRGRDPLRAGRFSPRSRAPAYRRPVTDNDLEESAELLPVRPQRRPTSMQAFAPPSRRSSANPDFVFRFERDPANVAPGSAITASAIWNWPRACRFSCGAASPTSR